MTIWACLCAGDILLRCEGADGSYSLPVGDEPPVALQPWNEITTFKDLRIDNLKIDGQSQNKSFNQKSLNPEISLSVVRLDRPVVGVEGLVMMGLRASFQVLTPVEYTFAGKAAELIYWDQNTRYCGCCGAPTKWMTDISKKCPECGKEWWPSVATAIIVRIKRIRQLDNLQLDNLPVDICRKGDKSQSSNCKSSNCKISEVLLVRAKNFRTNHYGLVAGFVETGESLEDAVRREVREETGIEIANIRYFDSQAWPYPFGLMVGFTADYAGGEIHLQKEELCAGAWFTRDNLPPIPDKASIARRLIDDWISAAE